MKGEENQKRKGFTIIFVRNKEMKGKGRTTYTKRRQKMSVSRATDAKKLDSNRCMWIQFDSALCTGLCLPGGKLKYP